MLQRIFEVRKAIRELSKDEDSLTQLGLWDVFCAMENAAIDIEIKFTNAAEQDDSAE